MNLFFTFLIDLLFYSFIEGIIYYFVYLTYTKNPIPSKKNIIKVSVVISFLICFCIYSFNNVIPEILSLLFCLFLFFKFFLKGTVKESAISAVICGFIVFVFENFINIIFIKFFGINVCNLYLDNFIRFCCFFICKIIEFCFVLFWRGVCMKTFFGTVTRR